MKTNKKLDFKIEEIITQNPWHTLKEFTDARIALGRAGVSLPTQPALNFQFSHAQAIDAVHNPLDIMSLIDNGTKQNVFRDSHPPLVLHSQAHDRTCYLQRPDLGRCLNHESRETLNKIPPRKYDLSIVIADGLSSIAIRNNALKLVHSIFSEILMSKVENSLSWDIAPISIVQQGRVAIGDEIGELLNADMVLVLIGERPGLSSPDSLGMYLTWQPKVGLSDVHRNCISNVREGGLPIDQAINKLSYLMRQARKAKMSGVRLKERANEHVIQPKEESCFLL